MRARQQGALHAGGLGTNGVPHMAGDHAHVAQFDVELLSDMLIGGRCRLELLDAVDAEVLLEGLADTGLLQRRRGGACGGIGQRHQAETGLLETLKRRGDIGMGRHLGHARLELIDIVIRESDLMDVGDHLEGAHAERPEVGIAL